MPSAPQAAFERDRFPIQAGHSAERGGTAGAAVGGREQHRLQAGQPGEPPRRDDAARAGSGRRIAAPSADSTIAIRSVIQKCINR